MVADEDFHSEVYLIEVAESCPDKAFEYLKECLQKAGLICKEDKSLGRKIISVQCSLSALCSQAESLELVKEVACPEKVREFSTKDCAVFNKHDGKLFHGGEELFLLEHILHTVPFSKEKFLQCGLKSFGSSESILTGALHSKPLMLECYSPMHNEEELNKIWKKVKSNPFLIPLDLFRNYFGEEIAYYFAWMNYLTWALIPMAVFGIFMFFHRPKGVTVDDSHYLPFYAIGMALWTILYTKMWRRKENELSLSWNTTDIEKKDLIRPEFVGTIRVSPITDEKEKYFPAWKRRLQYLLSFVMSLPFLLLGVGAMILSLNLNGYIKHKESPIHIAYLAHFAEPGNIFASDSKYYGWMVPTIAHSIVINMLNKLYSTVAHFSTDVENHKTEQEYNSSLIVKRVLFELFDCFLPLFYIAFYQLDIIALRRELIGLFWGDEIRRLVTEAIIPFVMEKVSSRRAQMKIAKQKKDDSEQEYNHKVLENLQLEEYEQFDDYIEMVVQYGYVTLFASAFPLCSIITILFLFIEARSDIFKLLFLTRRPHVKRAKSIGVWFKVLSLMTLMSMLSNCFLFGFASEQLATWVPQMYETRPPDEDQWIILGYGRYVVGVVFVAEHVLILCLALSHYFVSDVPIAVKTELARREHFKLKELKCLKQKAE